MRTPSWLPVLLLMAGCAAPGPRNVDLTVDTTTPVKLGLIRVSAAGVTWAEETYPAQLGEQAVTLMRTSPATLALLIPEGATGGPLVITTGDAVYRSPALAVQPALPLAESPEVVVVGSIDAQLTVLEAEAASASTELAPAYLDAQARLRDARARFGQLTPEEQRLCARLVATAGVRQRLLNPFQLYRDLDKEWKSFAWGVALVAAGAYTAPVWVAGGAVALVAGVVLTAPAMPRIQTLMSRAYSEVLAEFDPSRFENEAPLLASVSFVQGVPKVMPLRLVMRTLARSDTSATGPIGDLARLVAEIERDWPSGTTDFPIGPRPPVFREPSLVESRQLDPASLQVGTVQGSVRLVKQEATAGGLSLTFDDGLSFSAGPRVPIEFTFTLNLFQFGEQLVVPGTLRGRHGAVLTIDRGQSGEPTFVKYDFAMGERTEIKPVPEVAQGSYGMAAWDSYNRRLHVALPSATGSTTQLVGYAVNGIDTDATYQGSIAGLHLRRDGRLLVLFNPGDGSIRLAEVDAFSGIDLELAVLVEPPERPELVGGIPSAGHVYDRATDRLYVMTMPSVATPGEGQLLVVNATTGDIVKAFPTDPNINFMFVSNAGLRFFSAATGGARLESFDVTTGARSVLATSEVTSFSTDFRSYDPVSDQLFIVRDVRADGAMLPRNQIVGVDANSGSIGTTIALPEGVNLFCGIEIER